MDPKTKILKCTTEKSLLQVTSVLWCFTKDFGKTRNSALGALRRKCALCKASKCAQRFVC